MGNVVTNYYKMSLSQKLGGSIGGWAGQVTGQLSSPEHPPTHTHTEHESKCDFQLLISLQGLTHSGLGAVSIYLAFLLEKGKAEPA